MAKETMKDQIKRLQAENDRYYNKIIELQEAQDTAFLKSPAYLQYKQENEALKQRVALLEAKLARYEQTN